MPLTSLILVVVYLSTTQILLVSVVVHYYIPHIVWLTYKQTARYNRDPATVT